VRGRRTGGCEVKPCRVEVCTSSDRSLRVRVATVGRG
jgi:hypothetical protein